MVTMMAGQRKPYQIRERTRSWINMDQLIKGWKRTDNLLNQATKDMQNKATEIRTEQKQVEKYYEMMFTANTLEEMKELKQSIHVNRKKIRLLEIAFEETIQEGQVCQLKHESLAKEIKLARQGMSNTKENQEPNEPNVYNTAYVPLD